MLDAEKYGYEYWAARNDESVDYYIRHGLANRMAAFAKDLQDTLHHFHPTGDPHLQPEGIQRILDSEMKSTDTSPVGLLDPHLVRSEIEKSEDLNAT
jgi:hypothetical protein